jgi:hypothetical protein
VKDVLVELVVEVVAVEVLRRDLLHVATPLVGLQSVRLVREEDERDEGHGSPFRAKEASVVPVLYPMSKVRQTI